MRLNSLAICATIVLGVCQLSFGITKVQTSHYFQSKSAEFSLELPIEWQVIDDDILQAMLDPYALDDSAERGQVVRYGYGPPLSNINTNPPYFVLEIQHTRRIPERLMALQAKPDFLRKTIAGALTKSGILERNILETSYDTNKHIVRIECTKTGFIRGEQLRLRKWIFYTEEGAIVAYAICPNQDWQQWADTIESAFRSIQIAPKLLYQQHSTASVDLRDNGLVHAFFMILAAVVGAGLLWVMYDRTKNSVMADEI